MYLFMVMVKMMTKEKVLRKERVKMLTNQVIQTQMMKKTRN